LPTAEARSTLLDPRWQALRLRDRAADGSFFYSVKTTGVYCRPSCGARTPRPENVAFHASSEAAERAGFRPCLRCKPNQAPAAERSAALVAAMCRRLEQSDTAPTLEALARAVGLSPFHAHRLFKSATGVTPRGYYAAQRGERVRDELKRPGSVTQALYGAGYGSSGRFYAEAGARLGMSPSRFKNGGKTERISYAIGNCSLGVILVAGTTRGICAISLGKGPALLVRELRQQFPQAELVVGDTRFQTLVRRAVALVEEPSQSQRLPLDIRGTAFQERVWRALQGVPAGQRVTYRELAAQLGEPRAVRAVANACARNRLAVAVPCHRVVRTDGTLGGYRWGVRRKRKLLAREEEP
jgi:AraC family transcriptional regulator, regulatory protein of adaptative response / methylated-DNA-[protein]-cysteine methyltransferase